MRPAYFLVLDRHGWPLARHEDLGAAYDDARRRHGPTAILGCSGDGRYRVIHAEDGAGAAAYAYEWEPDA